MSYLWDSIFGASKTPVDVTTTDVTFTLNGESYTIDAIDLKGKSADYRLLEFIRRDAALTGTKYMCQQGGCGACVVTVARHNPITKKDETIAVNSCLVPVLSCNGWEIETVEYLGNKKFGYHPIQQRLVQFGGSQCGWCSSGMVMYIYSLAKSKGTEPLTMQEVEDSFDGNMCRCTGYRPILDAFKSIATDAPPELKTRCADIEDLCLTCPVKKQFNSKEECRKQCTHHEVAKAELKFVNLKLFDGEEWVKPPNLAMAFEALDRWAAGSTRYRIVAGNTGTGVFKNDGPYQAYLDVNDIKELKEVKMDDPNNPTEVTVGSGVTLTAFINLLKNDLASKPGFEYAEGMVKHISRVASTSVRNVGTIGGNLMMKYYHKEFPSDIFLLMETVGAKVTIGVNAATTLPPMTVLQFIKLESMEEKILLNVILKAKPGYTFRSFKIAKRHQNSYAYVNAGFLFKLDANNKVEEQPTIVFGGIDPNFYHATKTEEYFEGKDLGSLETLKGAVQELVNEVNPNFAPPNASPAYRKHLTQTLLYKFVLGVLSDKVQPTVKSGGGDLPRLLTKGQQTFDADTGDSPLYKPVAKLEAHSQVSGEAEYVNDIPPIPGELHGVFVFSTQANATLGSVVITDAEKVRGFKAFIQAKDIPGKNDFMGFAATAMEPEPIFVADKISHAGQAIGLVVADTPEAAREASKLIKVSYTNVQRPILTIDQAVAKAKAEGTYDKIFGKPYKTTDGPKAAVNNIKGEFNIGSQAHVQMETHVTLCRPNERGMDVFSATQWIDLVQDTIAKALNVPNNTISVKVRRLGSGYGSKITKSNIVALACAVAAHVLNKPVRVVINFEENMQMIGKRFPTKTVYDVGFDNNGKIEALNVQAICDTGAFMNESTDTGTLVWFQSCYRANGWILTPGKVRTNTPPNTWTRAPGSVKGIATIELIMDHIANFLNKDPIEVRKVNFIQPGDPIVVPAPYDKFSQPNLLPDLIQEMEASAQYAERKVAVETYNQANRWRKRGIAMCPMRFVIGYGIRYGAYVAIYHTDGTVIVSHGGIEKGQGLNTKVAQVVAHVLGLTLDKIEIKPSDNVSGANSFCTSGSMTSELVSYAAMRAAQVLRDRIEAVKKAKKMETATWEELIKTCYESNVDLIATHYHTPVDPPKSYSIWGLNCAEVEIDCLTGEFRIIRSDIFEDAGKSLSPEIDIGQVEGAYIMGTGLWTKERLVYDEETGQLLTRDTWEYKVPFPKCIPEDFRVKLISNRPNPLGVLSSKATGEPSLCLAVTVVLALRNAIADARKDAGVTDWFPIDSPITPEKLVAWCLTNTNQFEL